MFIYFFFNILFLPEGLLYTLLLSPLIWVYCFRKTKHIIEVKMLMAFLPFIVFHFLNGVEYKSYFISFTLIYLTIVFVFGAYYWINNNHRLQSFFSLITTANFGFTVLAIILFFTPLAGLLWTFRDLTTNIESYPRLQMLTYEPSYYSTLLAPLVLYYLSRIMTAASSLSNSVSHLFILLVPLVLSFSLGVIACIAISLVLFGFIAFNQVRKSTSLFRFYLILVVGVISLLVLLFVFIPDNPLSQRLGDMFSGRDTSAKGRTFEAMYLAWQIASEKSLWFGVGPGQLKIVGEPIIRSFYNYSVDDIAVVRIPSAVGETLAVFGVLGVILRFFLEVYLFFKTRTYTNVFRLLVFLYIFIYQFTGSFITNIAEYVLWVFAFSQVFQEMNFSKLNPRLITS